MNRYLLASVCSVLLLTSCHFFHSRHIEGNGNVKKEDRTGTAKFSAVDVSNAFELHIRQDSAYNVTVETDENLLPYVIVSSDGNKIRIFSEHDYNLDPSNSHKVTVYVSSPALHDIEASGACSVIGDNIISSDSPIDIDISGASDASLELKTPKVSIELTGASSITASGETKDLSMEGTGASHAECFNLLAENVEVSMSGASGAQVFSSVKINATASGASEIRYKGKGTLTKNESGASSVQQAD